MSKTFACQAPVVWLKSGAGLTVKSIKTHEACGGTAHRNPLTCGQIPCNCPRCECECHGWGGPVAYSASGNRDDKAQ
jgi:hypothetical protein